MITECSHPATHMEAVHEAWLAPLYSHQQTESAMDRVDNLIRMISLTDTEGPPILVTVTCGKKHLHRALECPFTVKTEAIISVSYYCHLRRRTTQT